MKKDVSAKACELTDEQLRDYSAEHLIYEISTMLRVARLNLEGVPQQQKQEIANILVPAFAIFFRNIVTFLYPTRDVDADVTADVFFADKKTWRSIRPTISVLLENARRRAHREVGHLTIFRMSGTPEEKIWDTGQLISELKPILELFCRSADPKKLSPTVPMLVAQM